MNEQILGSSTSYFIVGSKDNGAFPVSVNGFSAYRANNIQQATWYQDEAVQASDLLTQMATLQGTGKVFEAKKVTTVIEGVE